MSKKEAHLQMIQGAISRMAHCSFLIKGWSVTLVSALFALSAANSEIKFVLLAYFPAFAFWSLDSYFLRQERMYRKLFDEARGTPEAGITFCMSASVFERNVPNPIRTAFSPTLKTFHGTLTATIVLIMAISLWS